MGKGGSVTIGFWYRVGYHHGISGTPIDAFLEFRAADKTAWSGTLTSSGSISINAPNLFGGEKDQGGIVGTFQVMMGESDQQPNDYLLSTFGNQVPGWRGVTTGVFRGGRYGAMNPYPQKPAYRIRVIKEGWDDGCWYPEKAEIGLANATTLAADAGGWEYQVLPEQSNPGYQNLAIPTTGWSVDAQGPFGGGSTAGGTNTSWPIKTVLWARRSITIAAGGGQNLIVTAENGCVVFINGAIAGVINRTNVDIPNNQANTFVFPVTSGQTYDLVIKAFDEITPPGGGTYLSVEVKAPGLIAMNPAHVLYEARTAQDRGREPIASMADASWRAAADWYHAQGFGICTEFNADSESVDDFIARIEQVAGCSVNRSPIDGLWYLDVANGVYDVDALPILTDDDILDWDHSPSLLDDAVNSISVEYFDVPLKVTITTPPVRALALVRANGLSHDVRSFKELPTGDLATRVAQRELLAVITPTRAFNLTTTRKPYSWRRYTYFRLQAPKKGIADMVCLMAEKNSGTLKSGAMKITATQDIYSLPATSFAAVESGVDTRPSPIPLGIVNQVAFEAPYIEIVRNLSRSDLAALPGDVGYLMAAATDPSTLGGSRDYTLTVSTDGGSTYDAMSNGPFCPSALIVEGDDLSDGILTSFTLSGGSRLSNVAIGQAALWDDEICRVDDIDADAGTVELGRGCADTAPQEHAANSRIWFYDGSTANDRTEYTDGETVDVALLTNTGSQQLEQDLATPLSLTFDQRYLRPYPPGNLTIQGSHYPASVDGSLDLAWSHRDRLLSADQLVDTLDGDVGPEDGTTYQVKVYLNDTADHTSADLTGNSYTAPVSGDGSVRVEITATRDGLQSWQALSASFDYTGGGGASDPDFASVAVLTHMDGDAGSTTIADVTGRTWTASGARLGISTSEKKFGSGACDFRYNPSGTNSQLSTPHTSNLTADADFTIEGWFFLHNTKTWNALITKRLGGGTNTSDYNIWVYNNKLRLFVANTSGTASVDITGTTTIAAGAWYYFKAFRSGTMWSLRLNSSSEGSGAEGGTLNQLTGPLLLGWDASDSTRYLDGILDEVRITHGVARTDTAAPSGPFPSH